jgi:hypothetical protein
VLNPACTIVISDIEPVGYCAATHAPPVVIVDANGGEPTGTVATGVLTVLQLYQLLDPMCIATSTSVESG